MYIKRKEKRVIIAGFSMLAVCLFIFLAGMVRYEKSPVYDNSVLMSYAFGPQKTYYENSSEEDVSFDESLDYLKKTVT
ncbi:MAG: hypothetical protein J6P57_09585 [Lachnospiraceae bacterium]|nr:hypothetical protein [Lachnospiraceae bacterium]